MTEKNQTNSKRGGARKNAGRKAGSATKKTRAIADQAAEQGVTPLEVMLENMIFAHSKAGDLLQGIVDSGSEMPEGFDQFKELLRFRSIAQECAKDAAPYIHPKLAAIEHTGKGGGAIVTRVELIAASDDGTN